MTATNTHEANKQVMQDIIARGYFDTTDDVNWLGIINILTLLGYTHINHGRGGRKVKNNYMIWVPHLTVDTNKEIKFTNIFNDDKTIITEKTIGKFANDSEIGEKRITFMHMKDNHNHKCCKFVGVYELIEAGVKERHYKKVADKVDFIEFK